MMRKDVEISHEKQKSVHDVYPLILGWSADAPIFSKKNVISAQAKITLELVEMTFTKILRII